MIFTYIICSAQIAPIRKAAHHQSEMCSQLLFGERAMVLCQEGDWLYIECAHDQYEGWIHIGSTTPINLRQFKKKCKTLAGIGNNKLVLEKGSCMINPGSELFDIKLNKFHWLFDKEATFKGTKSAIKSMQASEASIEKCALKFNGVGYVWGGRSLMGIDCSGFTQLVYKLQNISLPRDAAQQATFGEDVSFLQEAKCGDLAFFDNEEGIITHVGILLNNHTIIHASQKSGGVVIDSIDQGGIISKKLKMRTGKLRIIKRYY